MGKESNKKKNKNSSDTLKIYEIATNVIDLDSYIAFHSKKTPNILPKVDLAPDDEFDLRVLTPEEEALFKELFGDDIIFTFDPMDSTNDNN